MLMTASSRTTRVVLFAVLCSLAAASASGQAQQQVAEKPAPSTSAQSNNAPPPQHAFRRCVPVRGSGDLQNLSRGNL